MISEFTAAAGSAPRSAAFDTRTPGRWIISHLRRYPVVFALAVLCQLASWSMFALTPVMIGRAAQVVIDGLGSRELLLAAGGLLGVMLANAAALLSVMICSGTLGHRLERDARDELYRGLLGKSQTFHNRQRIGDLVARATDDTRLVNEMINPGIVYLTDLPIGFAVTLTYVALIDPQLAVVPALYGLAFTAAVRDHMRRVSPALAEQRTQYGRLAAVAEEVITGIEPGAGRVAIDGVDLRDWNLTSLRSQIATIEQDVFLFSLSVADNIAFARPGAGRRDLEAAARAAAAHDFIESFQNGYDTIIGERGVTLSGGQRQRIALARAFLKDPRILILDDSTSAIDSATEDEIQRALHNVQRGRTTLLITHRLSQIRWADRVVVLDRGRIVANGAHDELLAASPVYRRIFSRYDIDLPPLRSPVSGAAAAAAAPAGAVSGAAP